MKKDPENELMRILFFTNYYPPFELGGQGQSCQQVVEGLKRRGHETLVLTSNHRKDNLADTEAGVLRHLFLEMELVAWKNSVTFFTDRKRHESKNIFWLQDTVQSFRPQVLFIWGMWNLPRSLPYAAEQLLPGRVLYRFAEYWPTLPSQHKLYWDAPGRTGPSRFLKKFLRPIAYNMLAREEKETELKFENAICVSVATQETLLNAGIPVANARIIYTGLDLAPFANGKRPLSRPGPSLRLLYAGRLAEEKGIHTLISSMQTLVNDRDNPKLCLTIAGTGKGTYPDKLRRQVDDLNLSHFVNFVGQVPPKDMPSLYFAHDVLVVPSIWPEPFARVVLEGMAAEMAVVASTAGGSGELIRDEINGLLFRAGDEEHLAHQLCRLINDSQLCLNLGRAGKQTVCADFNQERMLDSMENYLMEIANA